MAGATFVDFLRNFHEELLTDDIGGGLESIGKMLRAEAKSNPQGITYNEPLEESAKIADLVKNNHSLEERFKRILDPAERVADKEVWAFLDDLSRHTSFAASVAFDVKDNVNKHLIDDIDQGAFIVERMLNAFEAGIEAGKQQRVGKRDLPGSWR